VVPSHAHPDHIGGTIRFGGDEPVPAFPRARYPMAGAERPFWSSDEAPAGMVPVVRPRLDALERTDRLELTDGEMEVLPGLRLLPAPGHTPGHLALAITSRRDGVLYLGDAFLHESQFAHPDLDAEVDTLPGVIARTRRRLLEQAVREGRSRGGIPHATDRFRDRLRRRVHVRAEITAAAIFEDDRRRPTPRPTGRTPCRDVATLGGSQRADRP
jgi:glyoxylase-like metal-dependent hydrolase (beta-lactamase superfamily II)